MLKYEITTQVIELAPAQATEVSLVIANQSSLIDYFTVTLQGTPTPDKGSLNPAWVTFNPTSFSLRPAAQGRTSSSSDSQQTIQMLITLPEEVIAGAYSANIIIEARTGADNSAVIPFNLLVSQLEIQTLEIQPPEQVSRRGTAIFRILLSNRGNATHLYPVYAEDDEYGCQYEVIPPEVTLHPNEQATLTLKARPRHRNWASEDQRYSFSVKLEGFPQETPARFTQRCALPPVRWLRRRWFRFVAFIAILLALLVVAAIFFLPGLTPKAIAACGAISGRNAAVFSNNFSTSVYVSERPGGEPTLKVATESTQRFPGLFASLISVSGDGRRLVYVTANNEALDDAKLVLVELEDRQRQPQVIATIPSGLWPTAPVWSANGEKLVFVQRTAGANTTPEAAASPVPSATGGNATPSPTASPTANIRTNLEMWLIDLSKQPVEAPKLLVKDKLNVDMFYGDDTPVMCWTSTNSSVLIQPKSTPDKPAQTQTEVNLDGTIVQSTPSSGLNRVLPGATLPAKPAAAQFNNIQTKATTGCVINKPYSQNDPRWSERSLKLSDNSKMSAFGCPIVASAMLLNYVGVDTNPNDLITTCLGDFSNPLYQDGWYAVGNQRCSNSKLKGGLRGDFSWEALNTSLESGPAIVGLLGGQTGTHFLVVTGGSDSLADSYTVADPWDGSTYKTLGYFLNKGYRLRWLISYEASGSGGCTAGANNQLAIDPKGVSDGGLYQQPQNFQFDIDSTTSVTATATIIGPDGNLDQATLQPLSSNRQVTFSDEGFYTLDFEVRNAAGTASFSRDFSFVIDRTPPSITYTIVTAQDKSGKYLGPVTIELKATDKLSGIAGVQYLVDGIGNYKLYNSDTTTPPLQVKENGAHKISYWAEDGARNRTEIGTIAFTIELPNPNAKPGTGPNGSLTPNPGGGAGPGPGGATTVAGGGAVAPKPVAVVPTPRPTPTPPPTLTPVPTFTRAPTATLPPTATPTPKTTTAAGTTAVAATPQSNQLLFVSTAQLNFDPATTTQSLQISNKGTVGTLNWTLQPNGNAATALGFSATSGKLDPNASTTVNVNLVKLNLAQTVQVLNFTINSNGGSQTVTVLINPQPLPTATFVALTPDQLNAPLIPEGLVVTVPGKVKPDHANIFATYILNSATVTVTIQARVVPDGAGNWAFNWDTTPFPSLTSVFLRGLLCADAAETVCTSIPLLSAVFPLSATIDLPQNSTVLTDTAQIQVTASSRAKRTVLSYLSTGSSVPITLTTSPNISNNWRVAWDTTVITPTFSTVVDANGSIGITRSPFQLRGIVCSSDLPDPNLCRNILVPVSNLTTDMQATVVPGQDLNTVKELGSSLTLTIKNASTNINHVSLYANYKDAPSSLVAQSFWLSSLSAKRPASGADFNLTWDVQGIPPQTGAKLSVYACFTADEAVCKVLANSPYTGLGIPYAAPFNLTATNRAQSASVNSSFPPFQVTARDANGYPVAGKPLTFSVSNTFFGSFPGNASQVIVTTTANGTAATPSLITTANANIPPLLNLPPDLNSYAVTVSTGGAGGNKLLDWVLYNKPTNTAPFTYNGFNGGGPLATTVGLDMPSPAVTNFWHDLFASPNQKIDMSLFLPSQGATGSFKRINVQNAGSPSFTPPLPAVNVDYTPLNCSFSNQNRTVIMSGGCNLPSYYAPFTFVNAFVTANCEAGSYAMLFTSPSIMFGHPNTYPPASFSFVNNPGAIASFAQTIGTNNQATVASSLFSKRLQIALKDNCGTPNTIAALPTGQTVTFQIQPGTNGAGATFANGTNSYTANATDVLIGNGTIGLITAPQMTANQNRGTFTVVVALNGGPTTIQTSFQLTNL